MAIVQRLHVLAVRKCCEAARKPHRESQLLLGDSGARHSKTAGKRVKIATSGYANSDASLGVPFATYDTAIGLVDERMSYGHSAASSGP